MRKNEHNPAHVDYDALEKFVREGSYHPTFKSRYAALRMRYEQGMTYKSIGEHYGISDTRAAQIIQRQLRIAMRYRLIKENEQ